MRVEIRDELVDELIGSCENTELSINDILEFIITILQAPCNDFKTLKVEGKYGTFVLKCLENVNHFTLVKEDINGNSDR